MVQLYSRLAGETLVNTATLNHQILPSIAALAGGGWAVAWQDASGEGGDSWSTGIKVRLYDSNGAATGAEILVNGTRGGAQTKPEMTALSGGGFVVTWEDASVSGGDLSGGAVRAQVFTASGAKLGGEILVNTTVAGAQTVPAVGALAGGGFVVTWQDASGSGADTSGTAVRAQMYSASGAKVGGEFLVNTTAAGSQQAPAVAGLPSGGFVVAWQDSAADGSGYGIRMQLFSSAGAPVGGEIAVNSGTSADQLLPSVAALSGGGFVVTWQSSAGSASDGSGTAIKAQLFDAAGVKVGGEFLVNTTAAENQQSPVVTGLSNGGFVILWHDFSRTGADGEGYAVRAQAYDAAGNRDGGEFLVNTATAGSQFAPAVAGLPSGRFVTAWQDASGAGGDASGSGIKIQVFEPTAAAPSDIALSIGSVIETAIEGLEVGSVSAAGPVNAHYTYTLVGDTSGGAFRLEGDRLIVAENSLLDYETAASVTLTLRATDDNGNSREEAIVVSIADVAQELRHAAGAEMLVNTATSGGQDDAALAALGSGGFVAVWTDRSGAGGDASGSAIRLQLFDSAGGKSGGEMLVNTITDGNQLQASVASLASGGFAVVWTGSDGAGSGIRAQLFTAAGAKSGGEIEINTATAGEQAQPVLAGLQAGGFVVAWTDAAGDGSGSGVKAQLFTAAGAKSGGEIVVNSSTAGDQLEAAVTLLADGRFVIAWSDRGGSGAVRAQLFDAAGAKLGGEFAVDSDTSSNGAPSVAALASGGFAVAWTDASDGSDTGIRVRIFDSAGNGGSEISVNAATAGYQTQAVVTALPTGGFVVSWRDANGDAGNGGVKAQLFDSAGNKLGAEFLVNIATANTQWQPAAATLASGAFVLGWTDFSGVGGDASSAAVKARLFSLSTGAVPADDAVATDEATVLVGNVVSDNGFGADESPDGAVTVAEVNGSAAAVGQQIVLASGALLRLNADGSFRYDPNGAFNWLAGSESGAVNRSAQDSFTYRLTGGGTATVTVTVGGVASSGDRLEGDAGNNVVTGTAGADRFVLGQGGDDQAAGLGGNDLFDFGAAFTAADRVDGGAGSDRLSLTGDYSGGVLLAAATLTEIETLTLGSAGGAGYNSYNLTLNDANVAVAASLTVDGQALRYGENIFFYGNAELDGTLTLLGGGGNDWLYGGAGADSFRPGLGDDWLFGGGGNDGFTYRSIAEFTGDRVDGGAGSDRIFFQGQLAAGIVFAADSMANVETIFLAPTAGSEFYYYNLTLNDGNVAAGQTLTIDGSTLRRGEYMLFYGHQVTKGSITVFGGAGADWIYGGQRNDVLSGGLAADRLFGNGGDDLFSYRSQADFAGDRFDGGAGNDRLMLNGRFESVFEAVTMVRVETITLVTATTGFNYYNLVLHDGNVAAGATLTVDASSLRSGENVYLYGDAETDGRFVITGGAAIDHLSGGAGADVLRGGLGGDRLTGNGGADTFRYLSAAESTGGAPGFDQIVGFDWREDRIDLPTAVSGWSGEAQGTLTNASFDADIAAAVDAALAPGHALLFTANGGDYAGRAFLIVDGNGDGSYTAGTDYVIELVSAAVPLPGTAEFFI